MNEGFFFRFETPTHRFRGFSIVSKTSGEVYRSLVKMQEKRLFRLVFGDVDNEFLTMARDFLALPLVSDVFKK